MDYAPYPLYGSSRSIIKWKIGFMSVRPGMTQVDVLHYVSMRYCEAHSRVLAQSARRD